MNTIRKREMQGYFYTPVGYVFIGVFLTVSSVLFYMQILRQRSGDLPNFIAEMCYLWMLLCPILTMRLLAEEKQNHKHRDQNHPDDRQHIRNGPHIGKQFPDLLFQTNILLSESLNQFFSYHCALCIMHCAFLILN